MKRNRVLCGVYGCVTLMAFVLMACAEPARYAEDAALRTESPAVDTFPDESPSLAALRDATITPEETIERQIVYTASVSIRLERFDGVTEQIRQIVADHGGYVADERLDSRPGRPRSGEWKARVPVDRYDAFLDAVAAVGDLDSLRQQAEEVTEEYYDLQARIQNKEREESRLLELLEHETATLEDVLNVERALSSVREEIERRQGRLRVLRDQIALSTVTVRVNEMRGYTPEEQTGFFTRLDRTWGESISSLIGAVQWTIIAVAAAVPWLIVFGLPLAAILALIRRYTGRRTRKPETPPEPPGLSR